MANNLTLFTGENHYALHQELKRRKQNFTEKFGADTVFSFNSENREPMQILQTIYGGGLFTTKKLVILEGIPQDGTPEYKMTIEKIETIADEISAREGRIPDDTILILVSYKPDKRTKFYKFISQTATIKSFDLLKDYELKAFITQEIAPLILSEQSKEALLLKVGNNQFRLSSEIEKLKVWSSIYPNSPITPEIIDMICFGTLEIDSFSFFDHLFDAPEKCIQMLEDMDNQAYDWNTVSGMLFWGLRIYLILIDYHQQGISENKQIIAETKLHPFVINKNMKNLTTILKNQTFIKDFFQNLVQLDYDLKTGKFPPSYFRIATKKIILSK